MNYLGRNIARHLLGFIIRSTNNNVLLFTKDGSDLVEKLTQTKEETQKNESQDIATQNSEVKQVTDANKIEESEKPNKDQLPTHTHTAESKPLQKNFLFQDFNKNEKEANTEKNVNIRTDTILASIRSSQSPSSLLKRLELLNDHLIKYPEGTYYANSTATLSLLFKLRRNTEDTSIHQVINETLSIIGYCDPPQSNGVRVLSIDGGGMRGLVVINILQQLENLSGKKIYQLFDYICGVSTGGIITCCSVPPITLHLEKLRDLYLELGRQIFKQSAIKGASKLVFSGAYYDTSKWEKIVRDYVGSTSLLETTRHPHCPKICILSTVGNKLKVTPYLFRNYSLPKKKADNYLGCCTHTMFDAIRASAAAPSVFEEFRTGEHSHLDGGILANNPAGVALHEVKSLWPGEEISVLVSCGTGKNPPDEKFCKKSASWKKIIVKVVDSATDTEAVHTILNDLLDESIYYRFNPQLTKPIAVDEVSEDKIELLEKDVYEYCKQNKDKFLAVVSKLDKSRPLFKKLKDNIKMQIILGYSE